MTALLNSLLVFIGLESSWSIIVSSILGALFGVWFVKDEKSTASSDESTKNEDCSSECEVAE
jgi:hypothetical protein